MKSYYGYEEVGLVGSVSTEALERHALVEVQGEVCLALAAGEKLSLVSARRFSVVARPSAGTAVVTCSDALGGLLVFGNAGGEIFAFDCREARDIGRFAGHSGGLRHVRLFGADAAQLCASVDGATLQVWDPRLCVGRAHAPLRGEPRDLAAAAGLVFVLHADALRVYDGQTAALLQVLEARAETGLLCPLIAGGRAMLGLCTPTEQCLLYPIEQRQLGEPTDFARQGFQRAIQVLSAGRFLLLLTEEGWVEAYRLLDAEALARRQRRGRPASPGVVPLLRFRLPRQFRRIAFSPRPFRLFAFSARNSAAEFDVDFKARTAVERMVWAGWGHANGVRWLAMSHDDNSLLSGSSDSVCYWSCAGNVLAKQLALHRSSRGVFLPGDRFAAVGMLSGAVVLVDVATGRQHEHALSAPVSDVSLVRGSPPVVAALCGERTVVLLRIARRAEGFGFAEQQRVELREPALRLWPAVDEKHLFAALADNSLSMIFADSLRESLGFYGHALPVADAALSTDGYVLATVSGDATLRVWDRDYGNCRRILKLAHRGGCTAICLLRDTHLALTGGRDGTVGYWDLDVFVCLRRMETRVGVVRALSAAGVGEFFFVAGESRLLRRFDRATTLFTAEDARAEDEDEATVRAHLEEEGTVDAVEANRRLRSFLSAEELMEEAERLEGELRDEQLELESQLLSRKRPASHSAQLPTAAFMARLAAVPRGELASILRFVHFSTLAKMLPHILHSLENSRNFEHCLPLVRHIFSVSRKALWQSPQDARMLRLIADRLVALASARQGLLARNKGALGLLVAQLKQSHST